MRAGLRSLAVLDNRTGTAIGDGGLTIDKESSTADIARLVSGNMAGSMVVWQGGDSHRPVHTIGGQSQPGTTVASGSEDGTIKLWDLASGKLLRTIAPQHKGVCSLAWVPTESAENAVSSGWIASGMGDNAIVLSDIASGKHVTRCTATLALCILCSG